MIVKIGNHELQLKQKPEVYIDEHKRIMSVVLIVQDKDGKTYELHYFSSMDDPDLIVRDNTFLD